MKDMREWVLDLHLHTALSPCAGDDMTPPLVLSRVKELGVDVVAVTDHNSAENVPAFVAAGKAAGVEVLPGMEVQTKEDVHLVCLFDTPEQALAWQDIVYAHLPDLPNRKKSFGAQWVVDPAGRRVREVERLLLMGADLSVDAVVVGVRQLGGLCVAAHIDRKAFSLWENLGFIPADLPLDGVELTPHLPRNQAQLAHLRERGLNYLVASDAHWLDGIYPPQCFAVMEACTISELRLALQHRDGRYIRTLR